MPCPEGVSGLRGRRPGAHVRSTSPARDASHMPSTPPARSNLQRHGRFCQSPSSSLGGQFLDQEPKSACSIAGQGRAGRLPGGGPGAQTHLVFSGKEDEGAELRTTPHTERLWGDQPEATSRKCFPRSLCCTYSGGAGGVPTHRGPSHRPQGASDHRWVSPGHAQGWGPGIRQTAWVVGSKNHVEIQY